MKKLIMGFIEDELTTSNKALLTHVFGEYFGAIVSEDGHNEKIRGVKIIRAYTGAELRETSELINDFVKKVEDLDASDKNREVLIDKIQHLNNHQVKMLLDHLNRNDHYDNQASDPF